MTDRARVAIVGAGPQALTAAVYLVHAGVDPNDVVVFDPSGVWLDEWHRSFARLGIEHLRSASVHHPHPQPYALLDFARARRRAGEFFHTYSLPSTALFADFCTQLIDESGLAAVVRSDAVIEVTADGEILTQGGDRVRADHVVWATNSSVPAVVFPGREADMCRVDVEIAHRPGSVAVVGGGLTAAHLVERAVERGAHVEWLTRREVELRDFDTDPGWLGPKEMDGFAAEPDPQLRLERVFAARGGGTVPPWIMRRISRAEQAGRVCRRVGAIAIDGVDGASVVGVRVDGVAVAVEQVILATGSRPCVAASPPLDRLCRSVDVECIDGRPVLDNSLRLPGSVVHVMGRLAQLQLGPTAGNLAGARHGAERVVGSVVGVDAMYALADI